MARIRTIKPDFFFNEGLAAMPAETRLFFIGLWCQADRDGRMEDRPARLRATIFPYDSGINAEQLVEELAQMGHLLRYEVNGLKVLQISNFLKHQRPHHTEPKSVLPPCPDGVKTVKQPSSHREPPLGREGKGRERKGRDIAPAAPVAGGREDTPLQAIIQGYKVLKGVDRNDTAWDKANFSRYARAGRKLLDRFGGSLDLAQQYLAWRSQGLDESGLSWTLDTIAKQAWDNVDLEEKTDGHEHGALDVGRSARRLGPRDVASSRALAGDTARAWGAHQGGELALPPDAARPGDEGP